MKNIIFIFLLIIFAVALVFTSCEEYNVVDSPNLAVEGKLTLDDIRSTVLKSAYLETDSVRIIVSKEGVHFRTFTFLAGENFSVLAPVGTIRFYVERFSEEAVKYIGETTTEIAGDGFHVNVLAFEVRASAYVNFDDAQSSVYRVEGSILVDVNHVDYLAERYSLIGSNNPNVRPVFTEFLASGIESEWEVETSESSWQLTPSAPIASEGAELLREYLVGGIIAFNFCIKANCCPIKTYNEVFDINPGYKYIFNFSLAGEGEEGSVGVEYVDEETIIVDIEINPTGSSDDPPEEDDNPDQNTDDDGDEDDGDGE